jgi:hypothetical protein
MNIVIVLGAGATLAQAAALGESDPAALPPTDVTFFDRVAANNIRVRPEIVARAKELLGLNPFLGSEVGARPGMEAFFKDLFYDYVSDSRDHLAQEAYRQLVSIYANVLRRTTNPVAAKGSRGPIARLLRAAAARADDLTVITFNHDLVVENILGGSDVFTDRWCLRHGYGSFAAKLNFTLSRDAPGFPDGRTCEHPRPIRVLKLHGSLNWYLYADSPARERALLRGDRLPGEPVRISRRMTVPLQYRHDGHVGRPLVVPPIYSKLSFVESFMRPVWKDALAATQACDRIVFFGYSLPSADIEAEKLFQRGLAANTVLRWVDLINPDPAAAGRYAAVLPKVQLRRHVSVDAFYRGAGSAIRESTKSAPKPTRR